MKDWQTVLLAIVGNTTAIAVLGWLAKAFFDRLLTRDIERFKANLNYEFQRIATEHQIRFSKLHEKRAGVIARLYSFLNEGYWATDNLLSSVTLTNDPEIEVTYQTTRELMAKFHKYFYKNRIYLSKEVSDLIERFIKNIQKKIFVSKEYYLFREQFGLGSLASDVSLKHQQVGNKILEDFRKEAEALLSSLEHEFRKILGVDF